ncbi:MAG: hypothetical protein SAJ12_02290 [Jaaginema sp. PMC 1079.18]|nr:hypothetical protein [Jaaginema sp. PMC 1079.18]
MPGELHSGKNDSYEDDVEFIPTRPLHPRPPQPQPAKPFPWGRWLQRLGIGISVPVGLVAIANLPLEMIRRPVAKTAPILLLPNYLAIEGDFQNAIASTTTAQNQLDNATTLPELELVRQNFVAARDRLESLPLDFLKTVPRCDFGWYRCQYSLNRYQQTQSQLDTIESALAQEKQAQLAFTNAEQNLKTGKWDYLQAYTDTDRTAAIAAWQIALDRLAQVPPQTLAGSLAQDKLTQYEAEFQQTVGEQLDSASQEQRAVALIESARQFAWQAALASQNPPHTVSEWQHVENLWGQAIRSLQRVSSLDLDRYNQAQRLLAQYNAYQGQIRIRRQAEQDAVATLETAQNQVEVFLANPLQDAQAQLQSIRYKLNKIPPGTTVYPQAQEMQDWVEGQLFQ